MAGFSVDADRFDDYEVQRRNMKVILPENEMPLIGGTVQGSRWPATDTSPVKLTTESIPSPDTLLAKAELKAKELARLRQLLMRQKQQQLRKTSKQNLKSKNRRRSLLAARSRKRNR